MHSLSSKEYPIRFDSIYPYLVGFSLVFSILFVFSNTAFADTLFMTNEYKLAHDPTICILEPEDKNIPEIGKKLVKETENAIVDWEAKLKDTTRERYGWNLESKVIKLNEINAYDFSKCDIQIHFKDQPDNEEEKFSTLGLTFLDEKTYSPIVEIYYLQIDPGIEMQEIQEGRIIYYWYEYHPSYLNIPRSTEQLAFIIRHEIGHAMGLGHYMVYDKSTKDSWDSGSVPPPSVMIPEVPEYVMHAGISPLDLKKMVSIYGYKGFGNISGNGSKIHTISTPNLLKSYESKKVGFSIDYPADWKLDTKQNFEEDNLMVSFADNLQNQYGYLGVELFRNSENNTLSDTDYLEHLTESAKEYCESLTIKVEKSKCSNFSLMDSKVIQVDDKKAYQIKYFNQFFDSKGDFSPIINIHTVIPADDNIWIINALYSSFVQSDFAGEIDSSINSFKIKSDKISIPTNSAKGIETQDTTKNETSVNSTVPVWIKNNAKWWSDGNMDDKTFVIGIQYLLKNKIIHISETSESSGQSEQKIPDWIKNNAKWWSDGKITEIEFLKGIEYLVKVGIIKIN